MCKAIPASFVARVGVLPRVPTLVLDDIVHR
jgi:hypothetical protein